MKKCRGPGGNVIIVFMWRTGIVSRARSHGQKCLSKENEMHTHSQMLQGYLRSAANREINSGIAEFPCKNRWLLGSGAIVHEDLHREGIAHQRNNWDALCERKHAKGHKNYTGPPR